jgi:Putative peptidoglycan binding domain
MCLPAPVAEKCYADARAKYGSRVSFLGIVGDQSHWDHKSGHNCSYGRELSCTHPSYAHAVDIGVSSSSLGYEIISQLRKDSRIYYMIFRGVGYYPNHRGGGTFGASGHEGHVHVSFGCGTTFNTSRFFEPEKKVMTRAQFIKVMELARQKAREEDNRKLYVKNPRMRGEDVALVKQAVNFHSFGTGYGPGVRDKVKDLQEFWGLPATGEVNRATWVFIWFYHLSKYFGF